MRVISRGHRGTTVYTVTDAHRPMSEDIRYRQRRYLISMGIRTACLLGAVALAGRVTMWLVGVMIVAAVVLPYISVVFANGGREPENTPRFDSAGEPPQDPSQDATSSALGKDQPQADFRTLPGDRLATFS